MAECMQLFERIRYLLKIKRYSQEVFAEYLGIPQTTLSRWLKEGGQKNLFPHLEKLLELWSDVNPEWLYRGLGEPFLEAAATAATSAESVMEMQAKLERLEAELWEERTLNRRLTTRLLIDGAGDKDAAPGIGKTADGQG